MSVKFRIGFDLRWARERVLMLERKLARAKRVVGLREREHAEYVVTGVLPKRKRIQDEAKEEIIRLGRATGRVGKRGSA